ncbi:MAG: glutamate--tRNA ligase [Acidimicrobiia bacterium]
MSSEGKGVRVRFSPSPTGTLHVGGVRTALFNFLYARHRGGEFLLRIEDTDVARSRPEWSDGIVDVLRWLGLDWDGEPVHQSTRFDRYRAAVTDLLDTGRAYECFETPEELEAMNAERRAARLPPGYDGRARDLTAAEREALRAAGRPVSVRFRTPEEGVSRFDDLVRGEVTVDWATISDFVIVRSDATPVFYLANAVDDLDMGITHVIRGEDLLDTTHRILALRAALGSEDRPQYAHLPLIVGGGGAKLSKRHGAVAIEDFRDQGYLAEALTNYLALLGWAPEDGREVLSLDELVAEFDLGRVTHSAARFDYQKLDWVNGEWVRRLSLDDLLVRIEPFVSERYGDVDPATLRSATAVGQPRAVTLVALVEQMDFLFEPDDAFSIASDAWEKVESTEHVAELFDAVIDHVSSCEWSDEINVLDTVKELGLKPRKAMPALYAAIEGRAAGLPLFDSIALLGRERSLDRLRGARQRLT